ncbi:class I SAM-dependent methyltransferase [Rubrobacter marinus]|uniref:class I SAM-dependent methyltransferase n=1 Tax=Rubrobacter marinus TaxID=2653852 RepID=UPI001D197F76|nr:class I SAM-dependent methyltransferase [Rubrobacter marinus]
MNLAHRLVCRSGPWRWFVRRRLVPWALEGLNLGENVLELGPGPGLTTDVLRERVPRLTAVEIDPRLESALRKRLGGTNVEVVRADATALPFPDGSFSAVLSFTMLHHVPSAALQDSLLAEARRVLGPRGVFAGTDSTPNLAARLAHLRDTWVPVDPSTFSRRLGAAGFRDVAVSKGPGEFRFRAFGHRERSGLKAAPSLSLPSSR